MRLTIAGTNTLSLYGDSIMTRQRFAIGSVLALLIAAFLFSGSDLGMRMLLAADPDPDATLLKANKEFEKKNYADAAKQYQRFIESAPKHKEIHAASKRIIAANLRLSLFDAALEAAEAYVERVKGTYHEARAHRLVGNLYMNVPHWGTRSGGKFHRNQWKQGIHVRSYKHDKTRSVDHLEKARALYAKFDVKPEGPDPMHKDDRATWHEERIECSFDLAGVCSRFGIYENQYYYWWNYWGERDDARAETVGENDFDEYYSYYQLQRKRPIGLRVGEDGKPIFPFAPKNYSKDHDDDRKILFLLKECRDLDESKNKKFTGLSYYRQALLARTRFGMDRLNNYANIYYPIYPS